MLPTDVQEVYWRMGNSSLLEFLFLSFSLFIQLQNMMRQFTQGGGFPGMGGMGAGGMVTLQPRNRAEEDWIQSNERITARTDLTSICIGLCAFQHFYFLAWRYGHGGPPEDDGRYGWNAVKDFIRFVHCTHSSLMTFCIASHSIRHYRNNQPFIQ